MTEPEPIRARILAKLTELIGAEEAAALMESTPPFDWSELATKVDLEAFATKADLEAFATKADLEAFATKDDLRTDIAALRDEMFEMRTGIYELRAELHSTVLAAFTRVITLLVPTILTGIGLAFAAARID